MCVCVQCVQWLGKLHLSSFASKRKEKKVFHIIIFVSISDFSFTSLSILDHLDEYLSCPLGQAAKHTKRSYQDLLISLSVLGYCRNMVVSTMDRFPGYSEVHVEVSLGRILNPELHLMNPSSVCVSVTQSSYKKMHECVSLSE